MRLLRGLGVAVFIIGTVSVGTPIAGLLTASEAQAQAIAVEGNRRVEADTIRSYFRSGAGGRLDAASIDEGLKALYRTGLFQDVRINQAGGIKGLEPGIDLGGIKPLTGTETEIGADGVGLDPAIAFDGDAGGGLGKDRRRGQERAADRTQHDPPEDTAGQAEPPQKTHPKSHPQHALLYF